MTTTLTLLSLVSLSNAAPPRSTHFPVARIPSLLAMILVVMPPSLAVITAQETVTKSQASIDGRIDLPNSAQAICYEEGNTLRFLLTEKPSDPSLSFPRLNNVVHYAYWEVDRSNASPAKEPTTHPKNVPSGLAAHEYLPPKLPASNQFLNFRQSPTTWTIDLSAGITFPAIISLQLATPPRYAPEGFEVHPSPDGVITLAACDSNVSGEKLQFEPLTHKNTVGYWVNPNDSAQWKFTTPETPSGSDNTEWDVHVLQGCGSGQGGSLVRFDFGNTHLEHTVVETGHFQNFRWLRIGEVSLAPATSHTLTVGCQKLARGAVMDIRQIRLIPRKKTAASTNDFIPAKLISETIPDLQPPLPINGPPGSGRRTIMRLPDQSPEVQAYYTLYLPTNWNPKQSYPVIVEWGGNGPFQNNLGDMNSGRVEDGVLGYGLAGNDGFIWVCLPYLNDKGTRPVTQWWGNAPNYAPEPTLDYASRVVDHICDQFGGDAQKVVLAGFSRGSIACNFLGLHNDDIAKKWRAFVCFSHYDGILQWPYPDSDADSARSRLGRLSGRPQLILSETLLESSRRDNAMLESIRKYLDTANPQGDFTFVDTGFGNHDDDWLLRPSDARKQTRNWLHRVLDLAPRHESL